MSLQSRLADVLQAIGLDIKALFQAVEAGDAIVDQSGQPLLDQADAPVVANTKQVLASTDDLAEGEQHLYFTDDRARAAAPIQSLVAGTNVSIDTTDPENPVISATGGGGGPGRTLKQQVFTRSGTFTPSKALLDAGGAVEVFLVGGGGGGARGSFSNEEFQRGGGGGAGGSITQRVVIVGGAIEVTIGAGGRRGDLSQSAGTGGTSRFGAALYAAGGGSGLPPSDFRGPQGGAAANGGNGGSGGHGGGQGLGSAGDGGPGVNGFGGGGGGGAAQGYFQGRGAHGGETSNGYSEPVSPAANTGGGGAGGSHATAGGEGCSGICIVTWWE